MTDPDAVAVLVETIRWCAWGWLFGNLAGWAMWGWLR